MHNSQCETLNCCYRVTENGKALNATKTRPLSVPNGDLNHHNINGDISNEESDSDDDEEFEFNFDDDDDVDLPDESSKGARVNGATPTQQQQQQQLRKMKRAGVAYVSHKGQIVVLPEFETVDVDEEGRVVQDEMRRRGRGQQDEDDDEGRAPRIYRKKKKKFTYESTVRKLETNKLAEQYAARVNNKVSHFQVKSGQVRSSQHSFIP